MTATDDTMNPAARLAETLLRSISGQATSAAWKSAMVPILQAALTEAVSQEAALWIATLRGERDFHSDHRVGLVSKTLAEFAAQGEAKGRREMAEEAAKAMCEWCDMGDFDGHTNVAIQSDGIFPPLWHHRIEPPLDDSERIFFGCAASPIRALSLAEPAQ